MEMETREASVGNSPQTARESERRATEGTSGDAVRERELILESEPISRFPVIVRGWGCGPYVIAWSFCRAVSPDWAGRWRGRVD